MARPRCPFYGFNCFGEILMDSEGNQCALMMNSISPCQMEMQDLLPDWEKCSFNIKENALAIEKMMDVCKIFPKEC
jgi:hypothetical protein